MGVVAELNQVPIAPRCAIFGSLIGGAVGGIVGLVLGIHAYPPTAWFAVFEVGIPGGVVGGLVGAMVGVTLWAYRRTFRPSRR